LASEKGLDKVLREQWSAIERIELEIILTQIRSLKVGIHKLDKVIEEPCFLPSTVWLKYTTFARVFIDQQKILVSMRFLLSTIVFRLFLHVERSLQWSFGRIKTQV